MENEIYVKRKIYDKLLEWKNRSKGRSAILIEGAKGVGKSTVVREFIQNEYEENIVIDFSKAPDEIKNMFIHERSNLNLLLQKVQLFYGKMLPERKSVIVFDEVQFCPEARSFIKHLVADGRYDYIETGSLISIKKNVENILIPSEEEKLKMFPLDFEEFLWTLGDTVTIPFLKECYEKKQSVGVAHKKIMTDFRTYILTGGMPQPVVEYIKSNSFENVEQRKREILDIYNYDIEKQGVNRKKIHRIYDNICSQLSKGSGKFALSSIDKNARLHNYLKEFNWLEESRFVNICYNITEPYPVLGLVMNESNFKCFFHDVGLLTIKADDEKQSLSDDIIMKNYVAQALKTNGYELFYYLKNDNEKIENNMEIDFLITQERTLSPKLNPIEVKSGNYKKHTSIDRFKKKFKNMVGTRYVLHTKDLKVDEDVVYLPLYMAMFL